MSATFDAPIVCQVCNRPAVRWLPDAQRWACQICSTAYSGGPNYIDMSGDAQRQTSDHYSLQWGDELGFLKFIQDQATAKAVMPAAQLGWDALFQEIRDRASEHATSVYDAACGFGGVTHELIVDSTREHLTYVGADVHNELAVIVERVPAAASCGLLIRWDIGKPLPVSLTFDYILCRAAIHHTPDPRGTFDALCSRVAVGGTIAISAYRRKGASREANDDALRGVVSRMPPQAAFEACAQFTVLGKALQQVSEPVDIPEDLPLLGITRGRYSVQSLVYYHLLKCFYNPVFGDRYSTLVNYDWYHPQFAFRFDIDELREWFHRNGLEITGEKSIDVQHFVRGRRAG